MLLWLWHTGKAVNATNVLITPSEIFFVTGCKLAQLILPLGGMQAIVTCLCACLQALR